MGYFCMCCPVKSTCAEVIIEKYANFLSFHTANHFKFTVL